MRLLAKLAVLLTGAIGLTMPMSATTFTFTIINPPGLSFPAATGINNAGQIAGYGGNFDTYNGFIDTSGSFTNILVPGSSGTEIFGLNDSAQAVGMFFDSDGGHHAFSYSGGVFTPINVPGASATTDADGINNAGQIVGNYNGISAIEGFLDNSGNFVTIFVNGSSGTEAFGINNHGEIVGTFFDSDGGHHAFSYSGGVFTPINVPGAISTYQANGINDAGEIVGDFSSSTMNEGFLDDNGSFSAIVVPGSSETQALGINNAGQIVGTFENASGTASFAFLATPVLTPEPAPLALVSFALLSLGFVIKSQRWLRDAK